MDKAMVLERYEQHMMHGKKLMISGTQYEKEQHALYIVQYIVEKVLRWSPKTAIHHITEEIGKDTGMDACIRYIQFPRDIEEPDYYQYMIHLTFPDKAKFDYGAQILRLYKDILRGDIPRFPKRVFDGEHGCEKAAILLQQFISTNIPASTISELYEFFANSAKANNMLKEKQLFYVCHDLYVSPLDYFHNSLDPSEQDDFLYNTWQYLNVSKEIQKYLRSHGRDALKTKAM